MSEPQNAPKQGNPVLSDRQLERLIRALIVGAGGNLPEPAVTKGVRWAERTMVDAGTLGLIFDGRAAIKRQGKDWAFRDVSPEEARYILDGDGSRVTR